MRRLRSVKIVATLGPASSDYDTIRALFEAGADVFRLNMSHGVHADIEARHKIIRKVEADLGRPIGILADLQGPKLRVGVFANGSEELEDGAKFRMDLSSVPGDAARVQLPHPEIFAALEPGASLLVNDGKIRLRVDACGKDFADCTVTVGGTISNRKGVNVPDVVLPLAALSGQTVIIFAVSLALIVLMWLYFEKSLRGKALRATAVNRTGARLMGISSHTSGQLTFLLAAFIGALSGLLIGPTTTVFYDSGFLIGLKGFVAAVIAGLSSYPGALLGALFVGVVESFGSFWASAFKEVIVFTLVLPILLVRSLRSGHSDEEH